MDKGSFFQLLPLEKQPSLREGDPEEIRVGVVWPVQGTIVGVVEERRGNRRERGEREREGLEETGRGRNYRGLCFAYGPTGPSAE